MRRLSILLFNLIIVARSRLTREDIKSIKVEAEKELEKELTPEIEGEIKDKVLSLFLLDVPRHLLAAGRKGATEESAREAIDGIAEVLDEKVEEVIDEFPIAEKAIRKKAATFKKSLTLKNE
jgi:hypothetical protein